MESFYGGIIGAAIGALIGSGLIILNDRIKICSEKSRQKKKFKIWNTLEQTGNTPPSLTMEQISQTTGLCVDQLEPLLYEMIQEGTVKEGPVPKVFTRYKRDFSRSPYA